MPSPQVKVFAPGRADPGSGSDRFPVATGPGRIKRGRVMSYYMMAYMGASPFGSLLAGSLAPALGAPGTVLVCGIGCVAGAPWFGFQIPKLRPVIRPIYQRRGILPAGGEEEN